MTPKESAIYEGLKSIAPESAAFFKTGIDIYGSELDARAYMLAHISREIEGGLRDILCVKNNVVEMCPACKQNTTKRIGHQESILRALGIDTQNELAKRWFNTAKQFHGYAHRHGAWKTARERDVFDKLWNEFLEILYYLVGNYLSISDRIDTIISNPSPTNEMLNSLGNLLNTESRCVYFFKELKQIGWLLPLYEKGYFSGDKNPELIEVEMKDGNKGYSIPRWEILDYLIHSAKTLSEQPEADFLIVIKIIDEISQYRKPDGSRILNAHTDDAIIILIGYLPAKDIKENHWEYIREILSNPLNHANYTFEKLIKRFIENVDKGNLLRCLELLLSYIKVDNRLERYYSAIDGHFFVIFVVVER